MKKIFVFVLSCLWFSLGLVAQPSVARLWNEVTLQAIREDFARPTVHARNLFHISAAMYDAWAVYQPEADTYLLGKSVHGFYSAFTGTPITEDIQAAQEEAISFASYRLIQARFSNAPGKITINARIDSLMDALGYNRANTSINYKAGPAELGNYIASQFIKYGIQDGSNEADGYKNKFYKPSNPSLVVELPGISQPIDLNRWQPLWLSNIIDQSGNAITTNEQVFLGPEWGRVYPFSLTNADLAVYKRDGNEYLVYNDPGVPPLLDTLNSTAESMTYKWSHQLVSVWASHLDPNDTTTIDISPASIGNISAYPTTWGEYPDFYNLIEGGVKSPGWDSNPKTGLPYTPQVVLRGDYARVLAEFWADGPTSETPPGHWFSILNYVNDHPKIKRKIGGIGALCSPLEWDVKGYFTLGGALHDAAVSAWGIKGWYDTSRPITAIRGMAELGQSSDPALPNYHPGGLFLIPGYVELIQPGDPLAGSKGQYIGEIKLYTWRGPNYIEDPEVHFAGVGWIRARDWWPYQRPTFVSPPFAGYISGHSVFSRTAAEVLTLFTGDPFFPGGMGTFNCKANQYLVFEDGPSGDIILQWATYRDASDQCSLSRIWGGIHPPFDDMPGRLIGMKLGPTAYNFATSYFQRGKTPRALSNTRVFPNPTNSAIQINLPYEGECLIQVVSTNGQVVKNLQTIFSDNQAFLNLKDLPIGTYFIMGISPSRVSLFVEKVEVHSY